MSGRSRAPQPPSTLHRSSTDRTSVCAPIALCILRARAKVASAVGRGRLAPDARGDDLASERSLDRRGADDAGSEVSDRSALRASGGRDGARRWMPAVAEAEVVGVGAGGPMVLDDSNSSFGMFRHAVEAEARSAGRAVREVPGNRGVFRRSSAVGRSAVALVFAFVLARVFASQTSAVALPHLAAAMARPRLRLASALDLVLSLAVASPWSSLSPSSCPLLSSSSPHFLLHFLLLLLRLLSPQKALTMVMTTNTTTYSHDSVLPLLQLPLVLRLF